MVFKEIQIGTLTKVPNRVFLCFMTEDKNIFNVPLDQEEAEELIVNLKKWIDDQKRNNLGETT